MMVPAVSSFQVLIKGYDFDHGFAAIGNSTWPLEQWIAVDSWLRKVGTVEEIFAHLGNAGMQLNPDGNLVEPIFIFNDALLENEFGDLLKSATYQRMDVQCSQTSPSNYTKGFRVPYAGDISYHPDHDYLLIINTTKRASLHKHDIDRLPTPLRAQFFKWNTCL